MKTTLLTFLGLIASFCSFGQNMILNPGFENTILGSGCHTNQSAAAVTTGLNDVTAFYGGTSDGIDVGVNSACYAGGANTGAVHVVLAGLSGPNMFESLSFDLMSPIVIGQTYNISFYAANSNNINPESLKIGVSNSASSFGTLEATVSLGTSSLYVQYSTSFTATSGGAYLTIEPGALGEFWFGLDDFELTLISPPCSIAPTAVCQNTTLYLDGAGNATLNPADLDGGSIDNCGTPGLTFTASQTAFTCADVTAASPSDALVLTGVIDGPLTGGTPKAVELYVAADIADLSMYGLGSANNGGGTDGEEFTFPAVSVTAGQYLYLATDSIFFNDWFGFYPNFTHSSATNINGDDAIELFYNSNVVDIFGDINVDGTGQPWEHLDGWAYRNSSTGPDGSVFVLGSWSFSGVNALDGETTNAAAATPFPAGTYTGAGGGSSVTLTVTDGNLNSANCVANVTVLDTISPTASQPVPVMVQCLGDVPAVDPLIFTDEADNCGTPTVAFVSEISNGGTCPEAITRTYSITDASGNSINVEHIIVVSDDTAPTASNPVTINIECSADIPAPDVMVVNDEADNCTIAPIVTWVGDVSDNLTCPETITRTYSVADDCGNSITVTQLIVVEDITAPVPDGGLLPVNSNCDVTLNAPTGTDNCDAGVITAVGDVTFPITTIGTTTVTWTYSDACGNQITQTQDVIITVLDISTTQNGLTISAVNSNATYQWIDCSNNMPIAGETNQDFTATANGDYAVILTENGCSDTSACVLIDNVGINSLDIETLALYPNPTIDGTFTINLEGQIKSIVLIDMMGRKIQVPVDLDEKSVDGSNLESGKYIVQVTTGDDKTIHGTIIVQK